ncbi:MAG: hypothetical protein HRU13_07425 [Phycisphaerales bacterium]|nr:hypothetical protein [Phycisphaerales bacterium]
MARRFVFELQAVLEQRHREEQRAQAALAAVQHERLEIERDLADLRLAVEAERDVTRSMMVGRLTANSLREHIAGELGADRKARALAIKLAGVQKRIDAARDVLREASVQHEAINRLREQRLRAWVDELERAERLEVDDLMVMRRGHVATEG